MWAKDGSKGRIITCSRYNPRRLQEEYCLGFAQTEDITKTVNNWDKGKTDGISEF